jgi:hypothetical protein
VLRQFFFLSFLLRSAVVVVSEKKISISESYAEGEEEGRGQRFMMSSESFSSSDGLSVDSPAPSLPGDVSHYEQQQKVAYRQPSQTSSAKLKCLK